VIANREKKTRWRLFSFRCCFLEFWI